MIVEPEAELCSVLVFVLWREGYEVTAVSTAAEVEAFMVEHAPDVLVLDLSLPDCDPLALCRGLRADSSLPIIGISHRNHVDDLVEALEAGADDYLVKPFHHRELLARLRALLRRASLAPPAERRAVRQGLTLDDERREAVLGHQRVPLSRIEFRLLAYLVHRSRHVVSANELLRQVWEREEDDNSDLVRVSVHRLRRKLAQLGLEQEIIRVLPGVGFAFEDTVAPAPLGPADSRRFEPPEEHLPPIGLSASVGDSA